MHCASGYRSRIAWSYLNSQGFKVKAYPYPFTTIFNSGKAKKTTLWSMWNYYSIYDKINDGTIIVSTITGSSLPIWNWLAVQSLSYFSHSLFQIPLVLMMIWWFPRLQCELSWGFWTFQAMGWLLRGCLTYPVWMKPQLPISLQLATNQQAVRAWAISKGKAEKLLLALVVDVQKDDF